MSKRNLVRNFFIAVAALSLLGCSTSPNGKVARDWACKISEMQILPTFPPREDVHVGDIYWLPHAANAQSTKSEAYCNDEKPRDFLAISTHLAMVPGMKHHLEAHYGMRPSLPLNGTSSISIAASGSAAFVIGASPRATSTEGTFAYSNGAIRPRVVAFPDFMSVDVSASGMGAIGQLSGLPLALGLSNESFESATISIPVAESYGLPALSALAAMNTAVGSTSTLSALCSLTHGSATNAFDPSKGEVHLIHEVYYTRAIDINIRASRASAFALDAYTGTGKLDQFAINGTTVTVSLTPAAEGATSQLAAAAQGVANAFAERQGMPGLTLFRRQGSDRSVSMRRLFDRPVAIGFRASKVSRENAKNPGWSLRRRPP